MNILRGGLLAILFAGVLVSPARSAHSQTFTSETAAVPASVAAGTTETVFSAAFANQDAAGYSVVMTVVHGAIVASQSWAVDFTAYQLQTETLTWAAPANAAAGAYTVIVQIKNPAEAVQSNRWRASR